MLDRIKIVLGIKDDKQDELIEILVSNVKGHLESLLGKEVPSELEFIVEEITIRRFNRIGTEGMKSESVEGHSVTFYDLKDEFEPYMSIIDEHRDDDTATGRGKVMFI